MSDTPEARAAEALDTKSVIDWREMLFDAREAERIILRANAEHYLPLLTSARAATSNIHWHCDCAWCRTNLALDAEIERLEKAKETTHGG